MLGRRRRSGRRVVAAIADLHCGHRLGLLNPETVLLEEDPEGGDPVPYNPILTVTQEYLWKLYMEDLESLDELADGDEVILLVLGDLTQGIRYTEHCFAVRRRDQAEVAVWALKAALDRARLGIRKVRIVRGTPSHTDDGHIETQVVLRLRDMYPGLDIGVVAHGLLEVDGCVFDVAHHGPSKGIRFWTDGNVARAYLRSYMLQEISDGKRPARYLLRAHFHEPVHEPVAAGRHLSEVFILPSYCGMNGHARQRTRSQHRQTHGMLAIEIASTGKAHYLSHHHEFYHVLDLRKAETL